MDVNDNHSHLGGARMAATKQFRKRNAILEYLQQTDEHPSAEMVYNNLKPQIPDISLATVYRNLSMFRQQGDIISIGTVGGVERFDGNTMPHVHFVCNGCYSVSDLHTMCVPENLSREAEKAMGGQVCGCQLTFTGLCARCTEIQEKGGESA